MSKKQFPDQNKTGYYGYQSENKFTAKNNSGKSSSKGGSKGTASSVILVLIQLLLSVAVVGMIFYKNLSFLINPTALIGLIAVLIVLLAIVLAMLPRSKGVRRFGKFISILVSLGLAFVLYLLAPLDKMAGTKVSEDPFIVFVSANDTFGKLDDDTVGRSDTNILAVVNPKTHVVLMLSTPRDYYVPIAAEDVAPNSFDKLTHVGLYGNGKAYNDNGELTAADWNWAQEVKWHPGNNALMDTLHTLYGFEISDNDYHYVKINFTGFADLIDNIGGITVDVDQSFSTTTYASYGDVDTGERKTYTYKKGKMEMDGATALTFARERHSFGAGDMQRNKNQVKVMKALSDNLLSASSLLHWSSVVDSIEDSFSTDIDLSSLVSLQTMVSRHGDYDGWKILSYGTVGTPSRQTCTFNGRSLSVVMQNETSIAHASDLINKTLAGENEKNIKKLIKKYNKDVN